MFLDKLLLFFSKIGFFSGSIVQKSSYPDPLKKEEEKRLLSLARSGDLSAREKLITHNMRLVAHIAKKYNGSYDTDDLLSIGSIGLIKAVDTFDSEHGTQFATYTARCIENEILMVLRSNSKHKNDVSLSDPVGTDKDGNELALMDLLFDEEDKVFSQVDRSIEEERLIDFLRTNLEDREYKIICLRYGIRGKSYAQREVAKKLKISRSYVSRIEKKAIVKLRSAMKKNQAFDF